MVDLHKKFPIYFKDLPELRREYHSKFHEAETLARRLGGEISYNDRMIIERGFSVYPCGPSTLERPSLIGYGYDFGEVFRSVKDGQLEANPRLIKATLDIYEEIVREASARELGLFAVESTAETGEEITDLEKQLYDPMKTHDVGIGRLAIAMALPFEGSLERIVAFHREVIQITMRKTDFEYLKLAN